MKKRKIFLALLVIYFGYVFISVAIELYSLMKKYPNEFKQQGDFSFYRFYNTYRTLSFSEVMIQRGYLSNSYCEPTYFKNTEEKERLLPLVKQEFLKTLKGPPGPNGVNDVTTFYGVPVNCISKAKLINFEFKCKEAYATYACDSGDYINEFTYTGNDNRKCFFIDYKKSWGG